MKKPLTGKTVVVTRAAEQAQALIAALNCAGAEVIHIPTLEFIEPDSWQACDEAIENAKRDGRKTVLARDIPFR